MTFDRSNAARSVLWSVVENGGVALVSFISLITYSRFLAPADFGLFSIVLATVELLGVLVSMMFHDALVQREHVTDLHFDTAFTFSMGLSVAIVAGCALFAPVFSRLVNAPAAGAVLVWTALSIPASALTVTIVAEQRRKLEFRTLAVRSLVGRLSGAALGIVLVVLGAGFWGLVAQYVLVAAVGSVVLWFSASRYPRLRFAWAEFRDLLKFGLFSVGGLFATFAISRVFTVVVGVALGTKAAGYLNLSFRIVDVLWSIAAAAASQVALPVLARLQADPHRLKRAYGSALELVCLVLYPIFIGMAVTAPDIVELLFGRAWLPSTPYVTTLALLIIVRAPRLLARPLLSAVGRPQDVLIGNAVEFAVVACALAVFGVPSVVWAIAIWVGREVLPVPVMAVVLKRKTAIGFLDQLRGIVVPLIACASMSAVVLLLRRSLPSHLQPVLRLSVLASLGAVTYVATGWALDRPSIARIIAFFSAAARRARVPVAPC